MLEGLIPNLGAVEPAYPRNMSLEDGLGLGHSQVIGLLLGLLFGALSLRSGEHRLLFSPQGFIPDPLCNILGPFCLSQFLLQIDDLLLGDLQLFLTL